MPRPYNIDINDTEPDIMDGYGDEGVEDDSPQWEEEAERVVDSYVEASPEEAPLTDVEARIELASTYNLVLNQSMFTHQTAHTKKVEKELREFIRGRLKVLLGIEAEPKVVTVESPFSNDEVQALKAIAAKVLKTPTVLEPSKPKPKGPPAIAKVPAAPPAKVPAVAKIEKPAVAKVTPPKAAPAPKPTPQARPVRPAAQKPAPPPPEPQEVSSEQEDGLIMGPKRRGMKRKVFKPTGEYNDRGEEILRDVTPQGTGVFTKPVPMPPIHVMEQLATQEAANAVHNMSPLLQHALNRTMSTVTSNGEE